MKGWMRMIKCVGHRGRRLRGVGPTTKRNIQG